MKKSVVSIGKPSSRVPSWFRNTGENSDVVTSTRIRLARNISHHRFPYQASVVERKRIFNEISEGILNEGSFKSFKVLNFSQLRRIEQQFFVEERIVSNELINLEGDRGVVFDEDRRTSIMINEEDHIRMQCLESGFCPDILWDMINATDDILGKRLIFAYDHRRGFLTCSPTNSGTGMRISFLLHLPGLVLTKAIDPVLLGASQLGISARGFFGEHSEVVGNFFQLSNQATMGAYEKDFLDSTMTIVKDIVEHERKARERLLNDAALEISDKVYRSLGLLIYARTLSIAEFLNLGSALRLGISTGIYDGITIDELNRITLLAMPAHLQVYNDSVMDEEALTLARADLVRQTLTRRKKKTINVQSETRNIRS